eukprot:GFUD01015214.1.p1 GENE.GFUD01015214.1~~GFUD01015214.1.p1  ORF type:complete len:335 (+),score=71.34 GFUD01015214.1:212-1216(+)
MIVRVMYLCLFVTCSLIVRSAEYDGSCEENITEALANGANDVIVVKKSDGQLLSTGWFAQIGKFNSLFQSREGREVSIFVNSVPARVRMTVCGSGTFQFKSGPGPNSMSSENLKELNLQPGLNEGRYVCPELEEVLYFSVFLYDEDQKLVVTDIDGTITESDVRGQVLPKLGITAQHKKVVELFDKVDKNGYKIVYLTARSMAQDEDTKEYIFKMLQNINGYSLPPGPVLFSPITFLSGLIAEVVTKTPDIQKTKIMNEIWNMFKSQNNTNIEDTIVAGYGNKATDTKAYVNSGIPLEAVYIVNPEGELKNEGTGDVTSYEEQVQNIETLYPIL